MDETDIKRRIEQLKAQTKDASKEIEELQSTCNHKESQIKAIGEQFNSLRIVCKVCDRPLGYPGPKEIEEYMKKQ